ncbi:hypothetical protein BST61_g10277 [Cercospora zeina]
MPHTRSCPDDSSLGPFVKGCRDGLDFTVRFERLVVPIALSLPALVLLCCRVRKLWYRPRVVAVGWRYMCKLCAYLLLATCQLAALAVCATMDMQEYHSYIASGVFALIVAPFLAVVSLREELRSPRPSLIVQAYLVLDISWRAVQLRTSWLIANSQKFKTFAGLSTAIVVVQLGLLILECLPDRPTLHRQQYSPEESAGLFSLASFAWLTSLLRKGYIKPLRISDLYSLASSLETTRLLSLMPEPDVKPSSKARWRWVSLLVAPLSLPLLSTIVPRALVAVFSFAQAFLLKAILLHLQRPKDNASTNIGYTLIGTTFLVYSGFATSTAWYWYSHERTLCMGRSMLMGALYTHTLRESASSVSEAEGLTLMGTEVERIRIGFRSLHDLWCCPLEAALASWLLYRQLGPAAVAPFGLVLFVTASVAFVGRLIPRHQRDWIQARQQRTTLTANVVSDMESLQTTHLADAAQAIIQSLREHEIDIGQRYRLIQLLIVTLAFVPTHLSPVLAFAFTGSHLTVATVFQSIALMMLVANPLAQLFQSTPPFLAACACLGRIQVYLEAESQTDPRRFEGDTSVISATNSAITISGCDLGWDDAAPVLQNFDACIPRGGLTIVYGPTGSGKSTLCKTLLGECSYVSGKIIIEGNRSQAIGLCEQDPVLVNGSIKDNIIGSAAFDQSLYLQVIRAVVLEEDLRQFEKGDQSEIGSNGGNLSGGQQKRLALARALYQSTSIYILDDILGALDSETAHCVFDNVLGPGGFIKHRGATAIFATGSRQFLDAADFVIDLTPREALHIDENASLDKVSHSKSVSETATLTQNTSDTHCRPARSSSSLASVEEGYHSNTKHEVSAVDEYLSETEEEEARSIRPSSYGAISEAPVKASPENNVVFYRYYLRASGKISLLLFLSLALIYAFCMNMSTVWLSFWTQDRFSESKAFYLGTFGLFKATTLIFLFISTTACFMLMIKASSREVHRHALKALVQAPLQLFSDMNQGEITTLFSQDMNIVDSELPQAAMNTVLNTFVAIGLTAILAIASPYILISLPFMFAILWIVQRVYLRTARRLRVLDLEAKEPLYTHFLETVRSICTVRAFAWQQRFLALNNSMIDTSQKAVYLLAMVQRWLGFVLGMVVTVMATMLVALAVNLRSNASISGASLISLLSLGEILTTIVEFSSRMDIAMGTVGRLRGFARRAEKNKAAEDTSSLGIDDRQVKPSWPSRGDIEVNNVNASYATGSSTKRQSSDHGSSTSLALCNVSFSIPAASKVAIVGRSGSGKSTLFRMLIRLLDPLPCTRGQSNILVDDVPLSALSPSLVRERIIAIPQKSVLLPNATFRENLDPYNQCSLEDCLESLHTVGLTDAVRDRGGLESISSSAMFSHGQLQLFELARAILRKRRAERRRCAASGKQTEKATMPHSDDDSSGCGGILLLDEAGSAVDAEVYDTIWKVVERDFRHYTVVAIVHRLDAGALDTFGKVLVMEKGELVEEGSPKELMTIAGGRFRALVERSS